MTNISKKKLKDKVFVAICDQLTNYISKLNNSEKTKMFLDGLFTESEKIMIAKRFAVIVMIKYGYDFFVIQKTLKLSMTTIYKISEKMDDGEYSFILDQIPKGSLINKKIKDNPFWSYIETLLEMRMPPKVGKGRWKGFYNATELKQNKT